MALLNILHYPDPRLRKKALPVDAVTPEIQALVDDMLETMYDAPGIGLAATQVNVQLRVVVIDLSEDRSSPLVLINPEITWYSDEREVMEEGCLSVPVIFERVEGADRIRFRALNRAGESYELEADGLLAVCVQHELDHLEGRLFVDKLSMLKQQRIRKKVDKETRQAKRSGREEGVNL